MRIVSLLIVVLGVYLYFARHSPVASVVDETTIAEATPAGTNPKTAAAPAATPSIGQTLRSPIDRTHQVLGQVQKRNGNGEF
jgi:hypothetical protein